MSVRVRQGGTPPWIGMDFECLCCDERFKLQALDGNRVVSVRHVDFSLSIEVEVKCPNCEAVVKSRRDRAEYDLQKRSKEHGYG